MLPCLGYPEWLTNGTDTQDALPAFRPLILGCDAPLDFYAVCKREATVYDADRLKKYNEGLYIPLIFVRRLRLAPTIHLTFSRAAVSSLWSPQRLVPMSSQTRS